MLNRQHHSSIRMSNYFRHVSIPKRAEMSWNTACVAQVTPKRGCKGISVIITIVGCKSCSITSPVVVNQQNSRGVAGLVLLPLNHVPRNHQLEQPKNPRIPSLFRENQQESYMRFSPCRLLACGVYGTNEFDVRGFTKTKKKNVDPVLNGALPSNNSTALW